jgi:nickel/cobalt exporter
MQFDPIFSVAIQSSLALGLIHGINPCGHSWLVLTPFVVGNKSGKHVSYLTISFITGTITACLALGASLGAISLLIPPDLQWYIEVSTAILLIVLGMILIVKPNMLHRHEHEHGGHCHHACDTPSNTTKTRGLLLFGIGFVNMIIPCPTVAIMYGYALDSGNVLNATLVFAAYAFTTGITIAAVIYAIYRVSELLRTLQQSWIETAIMRTAGLVTVVFSLVSIYQL